MPKKAPRAQRRRASAPQPPRTESDTVNEQVVDLPDREVMSLLPTSLGSLSGLGGLGGGLLGGDGTTTQPVSAPATPTVPLDTNPLAGQSLTGADQTAPIAQQSSSTP